MKVLLAALSVSSCVTTLSLAQDLSPPAELSRFDGTLGNWQGSGVSRETADGAETKWTAVATVRKILGGHYIQEDMRLDLGEEVPAPLVFRSIYAWDRQTKRFQYFGMSNMTSPEHGHAFWTADGKMIVSSSRVAQGVVVTDQGVSAYSKDSYTFRLNRSTAGGAFFVHVDGTFQRSDKSFSLPEDSAGPALAPPPAEMKKVDYLLGKWTYKGKLRPMAEKPSVAISGRETFRSILGGHVLMARIEDDGVEGAPRAFRGHGYFAWSTAENCYLQFGLGNYGDFGLQRAYLVGENKIVYTGAVVMYGTPSAVRTVMERKGKDSLTIVSDRAAGASAPDRSFEGEYRRVRKL